MEIITNLFNALHSFTYSYIPRTRRFIKHSIFNRTTYIYRLTYLSMGDKKKHTNKSNLHQMPTYNMDKIKAPGLTPGAFSLQNTHLLQLTLYYSIKRFILANTLIIIVLPYQISHIFILIIMNDKISAISVHKYTR